MKYVIFLLMSSCCLSLYSQDSVIVFQKKAPLPGNPRIESGNFVIDSNFYVIGGGDSDNNFYREVWKYEIVNNNWQRMQDFPGGPISSPGSFALRGKGYICTGLDSIHGHVNSLWEYNPVNDSWMQKSDFPGQVCQLPSSFTYDNKGYIGFGEGSFGQDLWKYDPAQDQWSKMDSLPSDGRYGNSVIVVDSFAYFFGGYYVFIPGASSEVWRYNIAENNWQQLQNMPGAARGFLSLWHIDSFIICAFGTAGGMLMGDKYLYNISDSSWRQLKFDNFIDSSADGISFMIGNTGYFWSGAKQIDSLFHFYSDLYSFDATPLLATGITPPVSAVPFNLHPNPASAMGSFSISSSEEGSVSFYSSIGQVLYTSHIDVGSTLIRSESLQTGPGVVFYRAVLRDGTTQNGKVVVY